MKLRRNGCSVVALFLLGLMASRAEAVTGNSSSPVTLRGTTAATAPDEDNGSTIVLRGSTPPPSPPTASYVCLPGDANLSDLGCVSPDQASYADQSDYDWDWLLYDVSNRHRTFRPRRRAFGGGAHRFVHNGKIGRR